MIYIVRHLFICRTGYDYLKSFDFTGHISIKMNVRWAYFAASPISKNEIKDARKQNDSLCTRRVSHIDETSVSIYATLQFNERVLSGRLRIWADSNRVIIVTFLWVHRIIIINV